MTDDCKSDNRHYSDVSILHNFADNVELNIS